MAQRVLLISEYFWPDEAGSGRYLGELVSEIGRADAQLQFDVFTSRRLYRTSRPCRLSGRQTWGVTRIRRVRSLRRGRDGFLRRLLADTLFSLQAAIATALSRSDAVLAVTNPPLMPLFVAPVARIRRLPFIYLVHDLYPEVPVALGLWRPESFLVGSVRRAQARAFFASCRIIVLGRCMEHYLLRHYEAARGKVEVVPHWPTSVAAYGPGAQPAVPGGLFRVFYSGNLGRFQDFETLLEAAEQLRGDPRIEFLIAGEGARKDYLRREIEVRNLDNVSLKGFLNEEAFCEELRSSHLGLVTLEPQLEGLGVPSKTYNLLAAGVPLCAVMGQESEVARLIAELGCGIRVERGDASKLAEEIRRLRRDVEGWRAASEAGRRYIEEAGRREVLTTRFKAVLQSCLQGEVQAGERDAEADRGIGRGPANERAP